MKVFKLTLILISCFFFFVIVNMLHFGYQVEDAFWRTLLSPMEGTVWSNDFTEEGFNKVILGMNSNEVLDLLGKPLRKSHDCSETCFWIYTWQDTPTADFDQRWVIFDQNQNVIEVRKSFYID